MITDEVRVEDQWDHEMPDKYIVEGGNTIIYLTDFGHKIKQLLG
jgi:hypothetical protein